MSEWRPKDSLRQQFPQFLESRLRVLGEDMVFPESKHTVAQHHLQLHWQTLGSLEEPGCLIVERRRSRGLGTHYQEAVTQKDHQGKKVAEEVISMLRKLSQLLASGGRIKVEGINQGGNQGTILLPSGVIFLRFQRKFALVF